MEIVFRYYHTRKGRCFSGVRIPKDGEAISIFRRFDPKFDDWVADPGDGTIMSYPPNDYSWSLTACQMALVSAGYSIREEMIVPNKYTPQ
jgi:hypothetical protein